MGGWTSVIEPQDGCVPLGSNLRVARDLDRTNDNFLEQTVPEPREERK